MIRIAISKGRVAEDALARLRAFGFEFANLPERQLWAVDSTDQLELVFLKAQDVPLYVEKGVADLGIVGSDVLLENPRQLLNLLDLGIGRCQMCLAGPPAVLPDELPYLRLASKYPRIAAQYLSDQCQQGSVTSLQGSVELAPLLGVSDLIVDLVESGQTLKAHDLIVHKTLFEVSARLVANPQLYALKQQQIQPFVSHWANEVKVI